MPELRRVTGLMRKSTGRLSGYQAELREESRHRDKKREKRRRKMVLDEWEGVCLTDGR